MQKIVAFKKIILKWNEIENLDTVGPKTAIYQIYGISPIYGQNALLYIGRSKNDLERRLKSHFNDDGHIARQPDKTAFYAEVEDKNLLADIEETLITLFKPSGNSSNIKISKHSEAIYIQNHGLRGALPMECTNYYLLREEAEKDRKK